MLTEVKYAVFVEREKEGFDFFLNFSVLSGVLAVESLLLRGLWGWPMLTWVTLVGGCAAFAFYQAAIWCARHWGETIKTAFDLYRYALAEYLALRPFGDMRDELVRWSDLSFFIEGKRKFFDEFTYPLPKSESPHSDDLTQPSAASGRERALKRDDRCARDY